MPRRSAAGATAAASARADDRERQDPGVGEPAPQHRARPPVEPAVEEAAEERAQRLHLGLAEVGERERQRGDDHRDRTCDAEQREQQEPAVEELGRDDLQRGGEDDVERRRRLRRVVAREGRQTDQRQDDRRHHRTPGEPDRHPPASPLAQAVPRRPVPQHQHDHRSGTAPPAPGGRATEALRVRGTPRTAPAPPRRARRSARGSRGAGSA